MAKQLERRVDRKHVDCDARREAESARNGRNRRAHRGNAPSRNVALADEPRVEVVFYKEILDHRGFPHHCELMRVCYDGAVDEAATAGAIHSSFRNFAARDDVEGRRRRLRGR